MKISHLLLGMTLTAASCFTGCSPSGTANYNVVPAPAMIEFTPDAQAFSLGNKTVICYDGGEQMAKNASFLAQYIKEVTGIDVTIREGAPGKGDIYLSIGGEGNPEGYALSADADGLSITAPTPAGVFYGIQTLRKSLPIQSNGADVNLPAVKINDEPRFAYRGAHLDVSRHFYPTDSVKKFIDMIALHNINRLHWHLTDDQGWRIEIKKHPGLTEIGSKRKRTVLNREENIFDSIPVSGFFTQEEARDIVAYAADRNITVIPEIDLPGHMQAALTVYPELGCTGGPYEVWDNWGISEEVLCAGNDSTVAFINDVLKEVIDIFPSEYIHIGGDECLKTRWKDCPKCQAKIKQLGLKGDGKHTAEQRLQSYIMNSAEKYVNSRGRKVIGWDEILEGDVSPTATVMSWRGEEGGIDAAKAGHDAIMTPHAYCYFDYYQSREPNEPGCGNVISVDKIYLSEPMPAGLTEEDQKHILGVQSNMWTERVRTYPMVEYMELPRLAALCELQWVRPETKDYTMFLRRLNHQMDLYDLYGYNYAKHLRRLGQPL